MKDELVINIRISMSERRRGRVEGNSSLSKDVLQETKMMRSQGMQLAGIKPGTMHC